MDPRLVERMNRHVDQLAEEHGITVYRVRSWRDASALDGTAFVPEITRPFHYLIALHELGHCAAPDAGRLDEASDDDGYSVILAEGAAWAWAAQHTKPSLARHLRAADWDRAGYAFRTYLSWYGKRAA